MKKAIFNGVGTAIVTPFSKGKIDYVSLDCILQKQIEAKIDAIIVLGTTGEPCTILNEERTELIKFVIDKCKHKCKVIVGCGSNSTQKTINYYQEAEKLGADGALIVTPYYNKCTQNGIIEHYAQISSSGNLPIIVYNVPSRTGVNILPQTTLKLTKIKNVCGLKEASGNISQIMETFCLLKDKMAIYSGDDALNYLFNMLGAFGAISVLSNMAPNLVKRLDKFCTKNKWMIAKDLQLDLLWLINNLFTDVNPIPIKAGLSYLGLCKNELRMPLTTMERDKFVVLKKEIDRICSKYDSL